MEIQSFAKINKDEDLITLHGTTELAFFGKEGEVVLGAETRMAGPLVKELEKRLAGPLRVDLGDNHKVVQLTESTMVFVTKCGQGDQVGSLLDSLQANVKDDDTVTMVAERAHAIIQLSPEAISTLVVGFDINKTLKIFRIRRKTNTPEEVTRFATIGSGEIYADEILAPSYGTELTVEQGIELAYDTLTYASLCDAYSGNRMEIYVLFPNGELKVQRKLVLSHYILKYDEMEVRMKDGSALFAVVMHTCSNVAVANIFKKYGTLSSSHAIALGSCKLGKNRLHRIRYREQNASCLAYDAANETWEKERTLPKSEKAFPYKFDNVPIKWFHEPSLRLKIIVMGVSKINLQHMRSSGMSEWNSLNFTDVI